VTTSIRSSKIDLKPNLEACSTSGCQAAGPTSRKGGSSISRQLLALVALPPTLALVIILGGVSPDPVSLWAGIGIASQPGWLPGYGTIDPAAGFISYPLGVRAALDVLSGQLPLWNHFEGLGTPLLGEMQSAALFPPSLLLLLPHGPLLEHTFLQVVAGLGTYLFLRQFGLGGRAALTGALLFEFNGVFAWITNAIFNPIALLPWLFYAVESLFCATRAGHNWARRLPLICLGALAAALALYAGFPEVVYFYSLLLAAWSVSRCLALPWRRTAGFAGDLLGMAALALILSAPLLITFGTFVAEAGLGGHQGEGYRDEYLSPLGLLSYLVPYVYGPIFAAPGNLVGNDFWFRIGGYLGVMPLLLGVAGLTVSWRRSSSWLLAAWVFVAIGASHGLPIVHAAFVHIPLVKIAMYGRYLAASWIFACVILSAVFIDRLPNLGREARRGAGWIAACALAVALAGGIAANGPTLEALWGARQGQRLYIVISLTSAVGLLLGFLLSFRVRSGVAAQCVLTVLAACEAILAFLLPFGSYPRISSVDLGLVAFLRDHAGLQRVAVASRTGLMPNFGSVFGFPLLNYDDLPVPARTAAFVHDRLDPAGNPMLFRPDGALEGPAEREQSRRQFLRRLPSYEAAGVRYLLAEPDFFALPAYPRGGGAATAVPLSTGQALTLTVRNREQAIVRGILVTVGTYARTSDGRLRATLCQGDRCAEGAASLSQAQDNRPLPIEFDAPIALAEGQTYRLTFNKEGGSRPVALWSLSEGDNAFAHATGLPQAAELLPMLALIGAHDPALVLVRPTAAVFDVEKYRPYAAAEECRVDASSHDHIVARCERPSRLVRLEVFTTGWAARVNGVPAGIAAVDDLFQAVDVPAGTSVVDFFYLPPFLGPSFSAAIAGLLFCLGVLARAAWQRQGVVRLREEGSELSGAGRRVYETAATPARSRQVRRARSRAARYWSAVRRCRRSWK
jgi:hypothetical protein